MNLKKVTDISDQMVCEYGMSKLGFMTIEGKLKIFYVTTNSKRSKSNR